MNDDSSDYLNRTPSGAGDRRTFTISTWVKRGNLGDKIIFAEIHNLLQMVILQCIFQVMQ